MKRRRFIQDFKRSVVEQLLSQTAGPAELCRRYNISSGQLYTWIRQYADGKLDPKLFKEAELEARVRKRELATSEVTPAICSNKTECKSSPLLRHKG